MKIISSSLLKMLLALCLSSVAQAQVSPNKAAASEVIKDPVVLLEEIPKELMKEFRQGSNTVQEAVVKANPFILSKAKDKSCELEGVVGIVEKRFEQGTTTLNGYIVSTRTERVRVSRATFACFYNIIFNKEASEKVSKLKRGERIKVTGTTRSAGFTYGTQLPLFIISVIDAKLN